MPRHRRRERGTRTHDLVERNDGCVRIETTRSVGDLGRHDRFALLLQIRDIRLGTTVFPSTQRFPARESFGIFETAMRRRVFVDDRDRALIGWYHVADEVFVSRYHELILTRVHREHLARADRAAEVGYLMQLGRG